MLIYDSFYSLPAHAALDTNGFGKAGCYHCLDLFFSGFFNNPDNLVTWNDRKRYFRQLSFNSVEIGVANTADFDAEQNLIWAWNRRQMIHQF